MYIDKIVLRNFKCFVQQELNLSKITLLLGANSTGKSSLLCGVLGALQSDQFPISFSANGSLVNLGDFRSISHGHRTDHEIGISLHFSGHQLAPIKLLGEFGLARDTGMLRVKSAEVTDQGFSVRVSKGERFSAEWTYDSSKDPLQRDIKKSADLRRFFTAVGRFLQDSRNPPSKTQKQSPSEDADDVGPPDPLAPPPPSGRFTFNKPDEFYKRVANPRYVLLGTHVGTLANAINEFRNSFNYVGSFRLEPRRSYFQVSKGNLRVERDGQNYIEQLSEWQEQNAPQFRQLKRALRQLTLLNGLRTSRLRSGMFEVKVWPAKRSVPVSLADVGFGVGQLLPVLVADLQLPKGGTLAMSQPEIHLHPSVQADLAGYFVRRSSSNGSRYIIETHSEYLINRFRLLISRGDLREEDISVVYLTNDGARSTSHQIHFRRDGRIEGAPKEFFDTYMLDVMNIAMQAAK